ncbi:MAG: retropepsin-like aspartic protease [Azospirillaceae bacterium]|nr:retropepsin-like aspartic protease [Azospirillaceae bacterium]
MSAEWVRQAAGCLLMIVGLGAAVAAHAEEAPKCRMTALGHLDLTLDGNRPLLDASINGEKVHFLLDTGAFMGQITKPAAERLKLTRALVPYVHAEGVGGRVPLYVTHIESMTLGDWQAQNIPFVVFTDHDLGSPDTVELIGEDFLSRFDLDIDIAHNRLTLYRASNCDNAPLAVWDGGYGEAEMGRSMQGDPKIWLTVKLNGVDVRAVLDTGATHSVVTKSAAERAGITSQSAGVSQSGLSSGIGDNQVQDYIGTFDSFALGDEEIKHVRLRFGDLFEGWVPGEPEMLLGIDFLRAHRVLVSHSQHKIYFSYVGGPVFQTRGQRRPRDVEPAPPAEGDASGKAASP